MLKKLSMNNPLVEVVEKMPGYAKFIKDCMMKKRTESFMFVDYLQHYNAIPSHSLE